MKLELLLSRLALISVFVAAAALAIDFFPVALFACSTGTLVLLIATSDYSRRTDHVALLIARRELRPLAA